MASSAPLGPKEMIDLLLAFEAGWGSSAKVLITFSTNRKGEGVAHLRVWTVLPREGVPDGVDFGAGLDWPTTGHSSMLGAMVWLAHNVDQQIDAYRALEAMGA